MPNVIGVAMSCGIPCAVTDVGLCSEMVGDTGVVVPPANAAALASAWQKILGITTRERGALGERAITSMHSI